MDRPSNPDDDKTDPGIVLPRPNNDPFEALLHDPSLSEIMVNDTRNIIVEKEGKLYSAGFHIKSKDELLALTHRILARAGKTLNPDTPYIDAVLPDGSRVNVIDAPLTLGGPCITIRKFPTHRYTFQELMNNGFMDQKIAYFLNACVLGKMNLLVSGGTSSGKTTLLNALIAFIPKAERIISVEDTTELVIHQVNHVRLQTQLPSATHSGISAHDLITNAMRMRPDRLIVGECRKGEAFDMLQAMNTGHAGSMTTLHANSTRDALSRLETLCMLAGIEFPLLAIRKQIVSAIDLIIHIKRNREGKRRITQICEVTGMEGEIVTLQDIFTFEQDPQPIFKPTGFVPTFIDRLHEEGIDFPTEFFS